MQGVRAHQGDVAQAPIRVGDKVDTVVDTRRSQRHHAESYWQRICCMPRCARCLGKHVKQAGSLVAPGQLRFDFSHFTAVADEELQDIEDIINKEVLRNREGGDDRGCAHRCRGE